MEHTPVTSTRIKKQNMMHDPLQLPAGPLPLTPGPSKAGPSPDLTAKSSFDFINGASQCALWHLASFLNIMLMKFTQIVISVYFEVILEL